MNAIEAAMDRDFGVIAELVRLHARQTPRHLALVDEERRLTYAELDALMDRVAAACSATAWRPPSRRLLCRGTPGYAACSWAPCAPASWSRRSRRARRRTACTDAGRRGARCFPRRCRGRDFRHSRRRRPAHRARRLGGGQAFERMARAGGRAARRRSTPSRHWPSTSSIPRAPPATPKGIVQPHGMRWAHVRARRRYGYGPDAVTLLSTPLYSNTTLVMLLPDPGRRRHAWC